MRTEGLGHLEIPKDPNRNQARDLPSCGIVRQPTAPMLPPPPPQVLTLDSWKL